MTVDRSISALRLTTKKEVPSWYSLAPLQKRPGLRLMTHGETWSRALRSHAPSIDASCFQLSPHGGNWIQADLIYRTNNVRSQQRTLAYLLNSIQAADPKFTRPDRYQLAACNFLRSVSEPKGYLMAACISYEMKLLLRSPGVCEATVQATQAMRNAARCLRFPAVPGDCIASVSEEGFLYFAVQDGSGSCFGTDYQDRGDPDVPVGYSMNSDNIDCPELQLVFLSGLAAVIDWGERQTKAS